MSENLSRQIVNEVAEVKGVDVTDLSEPLFSVVDPEALDSLFQDSTGEVSFSYLDCEVTVTHTGDVEVAPTQTT